MVIFSMKIIKIEIDKKEIAKTVCAAIFMAFLLIVLKIVCADIPVIFAVVIKVMSAMIIYFIVLCIMKQKFVVGIIPVSYTHLIKKAKSRRNIYLKNMK